MDYSLPLGIRILPQCVTSTSRRNLLYKIFIIGFTFIIYTTYHLARKPISVVKSVLHHQNCSGHETRNCSWAPFDHDNYQELLGSLDSAFLFAYAAGMFVSGHIAERVNLRYFLTFGMLMSGTFCALFGLARTFKIHKLAYFILIQIASGFFQSTGWPSVVTCVANWNGKGNRGFIMGIWNAHMSIGNILGSVIAGLFVNYNWALSFIVPGIIIAVTSIFVFFFLVPQPQDVGLPPPHTNAPQRVDVNDVSTNEEDDAEDMSYPDDKIGDGINNDLTSGDSLDLIHPDGGPPAISFCSALRIPGVIEFSLCLFFTKLVSYTFLFWLPNYITHTTPFGAEKAADLSTFFDVGGIVGGIFAGYVSDRTGKRATPCLVMLILAAPLLFLYQHFGSRDLISNIVLLLCCGATVNGPYTLITTAVAADLGTHDVLQGNARALATVTAIIDGTGSIGAAFGPLLAGLISPTGWQNVFYVLIAADIAALLFLIRIVVKEMRTVGGSQDAS